MEKRKPEALTKTAAFLAGYDGYEKLCSDTFLGFGTNKAAGQY